MVPSLVLENIDQLTDIISCVVSDRHVKCVYLSLPSTTILFTSSRLTRKTPGDGQKPSCKRCEKTGLSCIWQDLSSGFRHGSSASARYSFADDQPWLPIGQGTIIPVLVASCTHRHRYRSLSLPLTVAHPDRSGLQLCR